MFLMRRSRDEVHVAILNQNISLQSRSDKTFSAMCPGLLGSMLCHGLEVLPEPLIGGLIKLDDEFEVEKIIRRMNIHCYSAQDYAHETTIFTKVSTQTGNSRDRNSRRQATFADIKALNSVV